MAMLSETLETGLRQYEIGPKIKALRLAKKLNLSTLGEHTGLSPAMLSKFERGNLFPTLPTLLRIALVFGVGLDHFFTDEERPAVAVVRKQDRIRLPHPPDANPPSYLFESLDYPANNRKMEAYFAEFPGQSTPAEPHKHDGAEFIYVIDGALAVSIGGEETELNAGDSMYFDSGREHSYRRAGRATCHAIVVTTPAQASPIASQTQERTATVTQALKTSSTAPT
jgi:transcriptional regulator with XRE-family HTH domain